MQEHSMFSTVKIEKLNLSIDLLYSLVIMKDEDKLIYSISFKTDEPGRDVLGCDLTQMEGL